MFHNAKIAILIKTNDDLFMVFHHLSEAVFFDLTITPNGSFKDYFAA